MAKRVRIKLTGSAANKNKPPARARAGRENGTRPGRTRIEAETKPIRARLKSAEETTSKKADYEVGHGKPPKSGQFHKNDGRHRPGRPKGSKNIATLVLEAAAAKIVVTIDGKKRRISKSQAACIQLANKGAMGNETLMLKFIDLIADIEARAEAARPAEYPFSDLDNKVITEVYKRLRPYEEREND